MNSSKEELEAEIKELEVSLSILQEQRKEVESKLKYLPWTMYSDEKINESGTGCTSAHQIIARV